jgi:hypothetical protein
MLHVNCKYPGVRYNDLRIEDDPSPIAKILLGMGTNITVPPYLVQVLNYPVCDGMCMKPATKPEIKHISRADWFDNADYKSRKSIFFRNK